MIEINETKLNEVVEAALAKVKDDSRWTNAILRGDKLLTSNIRICTLTAHGFWFCPNPGTSTRRTAFVNVKLIKKRCRANIGRLSVC
jgi:hypothetical protein